jgi:hypothetical protein
MATAHVVEIVQEIFHIIFVLFLYIFFSVDLVDVHHVLDFVLAHVLDAGHDHIVSIYEAFFDHL